MIFIVICIFLILSTSFSENRSDSSALLERFWEKIGPHLEKPFSFDSSKLSTLSLRSFITDRRRLWTNAVVPYEIDTTFDWYQHEKIYKAIKLFHSVSCVRFKEHTTEHDFVRFTRVTGHSGCSTTIGRSGGLQNIWLEDDCFYHPAYKGAVVHEMMHSLGFIHEHQRADRDCYLKVTGKGRLLLNLKIILNTDTRFPFDYNSLMEYKERWYFKARNGQRLGNLAGTLTQLDKDKLNYLYCGKPHYCDLHPQQCAADDLAERFCRVNL